ncbi:DoxX family protein [Actinomadura parmotrematis]|uniref:DoxX family protein n=1 Tax=Actinomadura parmotrematis TaxID=2864039 RepID=A0ABS7FMA0_9ACTN|nr:DoxX family protein [Actinomadura parmotrematis]MBW8481125.1 DoxX family protein [Actinomadura parmotrematis]
MSGLKARGAVYWVATLLVCAELVVGGAWDVARVDRVRDVTERLGYPSYALVVLGTWKLLGAAALLAPRLPRLKEWAYAGVVLADTTAIASHVWKGFGWGEVAVLGALLVLTGASWALRPVARGGFQGRAAA